MTDSMIFDWSAANAGAEYSGASEEDERKITWFDALLGDPLPNVEDWTPPMLTQYRGETGKRELRKICDSPSSGPVNLISDKARDKLRDIWERHAKLYPVELDDAKAEPYFMVVVTTVRDCLDRERSDGPLQKYGPTPHLFASVYHWVFDQQCIGDADIFRIPDSQTDIFVSEYFKHRVEGAGLRGFCLRKSFWDDDPWISQ